MTNNSNKRLLSFSFSNFLSYKEEQTIFFTEDSKYSAETKLSSYDIPNQKEKTLPVTVIYGANASGKTNVLFALKTLSRLFGRIEKKSQTIAFYKPFKLDDDKEKATSLSVEFLLGNDCYTYDVMFDRNSFIEENLKKNDKTLYKKEKDNSKISFKDPSISEYDKGYVYDLLQRRQDVTVLELLSFRGSSQYEQVRFFLENFDEDENSRDSSLLENLYNNKEEQRKILEWLKFAEIGIENINIEKETLDKNIIQKNKLIIKKLEDILPEVVLRNNANSEDFPEAIYKVSFEHKGKNGKTYSLSGAMESRGTQKFFEKMVVFSVAFSKGGIFLFDEFETHFHPILVKYIIDVFHNKEINKAGAQLIFSTHDVNLLSPSVLRRDEIWFSEKDDEGKSSLYSLSQFKDVRNNSDYRKGYLSGRFGAIPYIDGIDDLICALEKQDA